MCYMFVNINDSCQLGWHGESNGHQSCHTVTLSDDVIQIIMSFENDNVHSPNKIECLKFLTFYSKMPVEAPIFTRNKLNQGGPNDLHYPLV